MFAHAYLDFRWMYVYCRCLSTQALYHQARNIGPAFNNPYRPDVFLNYLNRLSKQTPTNQRPWRETTIRGSTACETKPRKPYEDWWEPQCPINVYRDGHNDSVCSDSGTWTLNCTGLTTRREWEGFRLMTDVFHSPLGEHGQGLTGFSAKLPPRRRPRPSRSRCYRNSSHESRH